MMKDFAMHIMDIGQNSISAGATLIELLIEENPITDNLIMVLKDNGKGIPEDMIASVTDPYVTSRTTRKVGLGLPLLKQHADSTGGNLTIKSESQKGTEVTANFGLTHLDRQPYGDLAGTIVLLAAANPEIRFVYEHRTDIGRYIFDTKEVNEMLEGVPISDASIIQFLKEMINENLREINISGY